MEHIDNALKATCKKSKIVSFTSAIMKNIVVFPSLKLICCIAFGSVSSACCLRKFVAINF